MYNGIGLATPRGSGTNGYVVKNLSVVSQRPRPGEHSTAVTDTSDMLPFRKPDESILLHEKKRQIEIQCLELQLKLEDEELGDDEIQKRVDQFRESLLIRLSAGKEIANPRIKSIPSHDSHQVAKAKQDENSRMMKALGISEASYVEGATFDRERIEAEKLLKANEREILKAKLLQKQKAADLDYGSDSSVSPLQQSLREREKLNNKDSNSTERFRSRKIETKEVRERSPRNSNYNRERSPNMRDRSSQHRREAPVSRRLEGKKSPLIDRSLSPPPRNNSRREAISRDRLSKSRNRFASRSDGEVSVSPKRVHLSGNTLKRTRTSRSPKKYSRRSVSRSPSREELRRYPRSPVRERSRNNMRLPAPSNRRQSSRTVRARRRSLSSSSSKAASRSASPTSRIQDKDSSRRRRPSISCLPLTKSTNTRSPIQSQRPSEVRSQSYTRRRSPQLKRRSISRSPVRARRRSVSRSPSVSKSRSPSRNRSKRAHSPQRIAGHSRAYSRSPISRENVLKSRSRSLHRSSASYRSKDRAISRSHRTNNSAISPRRDVLRGRRELSNSRSPVSRLARGRSVSSVSNSSSGSSYSSSSSPPRSRKREVSIDSK